MDRLPHQSCYNHNIPSVAASNEKAYLTGHPPPFLVRTVFLTGFPLDVKERELANLLRFIPGYEASQLSHHNNQPHGFALFCHPDAAVHALRMLQGLQFDKDCLLRAELAKKDLMRLPDQIRTPASKAPVARSYFPNMLATGARASDDNAPCNTLFVGNLGPLVQESELKLLFSNEPGFVLLKAVKNLKGIACFVEFIDTAAATDCRKKLDGHIMKSSEESRGLRISFSRNPMGTCNAKRKREQSHEKCTLNNKQ